MNKQQAMKRNLKRAKDALANFVYILLTRKYVLEKNGVKETDMPSELTFTTYVLCGYVVMFEHIIEQTFSYKLDDEQCEHVRWSMKFLLRDCNNYMVVCLQLRGANGRRLAGLKPAFNRFRDAQRKFGWSLGD